MLVLGCSVPQLRSPVELRWLRFHRSMPPAVTRIAVTARIDALAQTLHETRMRISMPRGYFMTKTLRNHFLPGVRSVALAASLILLTALSASPARADRCDDTAKQLANGIDGLKV